MKKPYQLAFLVLISLLIFTIFKCSLYKKTSSTYKELYYKGVQDYEVINTNQGIIINRQEIIETDLKKDIHKYVTKIKYLEQIKNRIKTVIQYNQITKVDSIRLSFIDTLVFYDSVRNVRYIVPPKRFYGSGEYYKIKGVINLTNVEIDNIELPNEVTTAIAIKRGLLRNKPELYLYNSNIYIQNNNLKSITLQKSPTRLNKALTLAIAFGAGYLIAK